MSGGERKVTSAERADATWERLGSLCDLLESAVGDVRRGVESRKGYRVALGLVSIANVLQEALRLQGRVDQMEEERT